MKPEAAEEAASKQPVPPDGIHYLSRVVGGSPRMSLDQKAAFGMAIEKAFEDASRLQVAFALREALRKLLAVRMPEPSGAVELEPSDPVLQYVAEAGHHAEEFITACMPLLDLLPTLAPALASWNTFLRENDLFEDTPRSMTARQLVGVAVARTEKQLGGVLRLEPKELTEFFKDIDLFNGEGPGLSGWREVLWKSRGQTDESGRTKREPTRGSLLSDLEFAADRWAKRQKKNDQPEADADPAAEKKKG